MRRAFASNVALLLAIGASSLFLNASPVLVPSGTWALTGDLTETRAGAAGVLLSDGVVLITGGSGPDGRSASAERYSATSGTFISTAPMSTARANHSATVLNDGRVLVVGGHDADGVAISGAELYDPVANMWAPAGTLVHARAGHTATMLPDGRVLVAGGENGDGALASMEVYSPVFEEFLLVAAPMTAARTRHAAAFASDKVLIIGGWDGAAALASVDVYDPATDSVAAGSEMLAARAEHTATTLLSGNVLVAGGMNAQGELLTAEVFDAAAGAFVATANAMSTARRNHIAILLPHNNSVLIAGGWSDGAESATAELYRAWQDGGIFVSTGSSTSPRNWSAGSALSFAASATNRSGSADGLVLVAGGNGSSAELYGFATLKTDKDDYSPGMTVRVSGSGWQPNQPVTFYLRELPAEHYARLFTIDADNSGNIAWTDLFLVEEHHLGVHFLMTAGDGVSQAHMAFTDSNPQSVSVASPTSVTVAPGATAVFGNLTVVGGGNDNPCTITLSTVSGGGSGLPVGAAAVFGTNPLNMIKLDVGTSLNVTTSSFTPPGTFTFKVLGTSGTGCQGQGPGESNLLTLIVAAPTVNTTTTASNATATFGDASVALNATVSASANGGNVLFTIKDGGTTIGTATSGTVAGGVASANFSLSSIAAKTYTIEAAYSGATGFNASNNAAPFPTLVVGKAATSTVVTCGAGPFTYNGAAQTPCLANVTGAGGLNQTLSVNYTNNTNAGSASASATFAESINYLGSGDSENFTIGKTGATVVVDGYSGNYDGAAHGATGTATGVLGEALAGLDLGASFTNVPGGTANWTFTDGTGNYNNANGTASIVINKANATISVSGYTNVYDGSAHGATGTATGVLSEALAGLNLGASFTNVPGGTAHWTFTDVTGNYNNANGTVPIVINKANATIDVNGYTGVYDGSTHGATGTATGVLSEALDGLALGASFTNVPGGTATWTFTDVTGNYNNSSGTASIVIDKANATIDIDGYEGVYDGSAHGATGTATGVLSELLAGLDLGASFTNVPGGTANWTFTDVTGNYNDALGTASIIINKANATIDVNGYTGVYDGAAHGATGTATGVLSEALDGLALGASFTNVPGGTANWTFTDVTGNYNDADGTASIVINKANATIDVDGYSGVYDGAAHGATGTATGVLNEPLAGLDLGAQFTNVPGGTANWTFANENYNDASGTASIVINKANATIHVDGYTGVYDGSAHSATGTAIGILNEPLAGLNLGAQFTNVPGGTANWTFTNQNYNDASGTAPIVINKATPIVTVSFGPSPITFDGNPHPATVTVTGVSGPLAVPGNGTTTTTYTRNAAPFAAIPTLIGNYTAAASFTSTNVNYTDAGPSAPASLVIVTACSSFNGFLSPIGGAVEKGTGGSLLDPVRSFKLNSTIPVKFAATCSGAPLVTGSHTLKATKYSNAGTPDTPIDATPTDAATTGNQFRLTGAEWHFNLSTKALGGSAQGIWLLEATLFDGSTYTVWVEIKK